MSLRGPCLAAALLLAALAGVARADEAPFGAAGKLREASRTIRVEMSDAMRFDPAALTVKRGETVRFVVKNRGKVNHEMVLGTLAELQEHAALMRKFPHMEHAEDNMVHVRPGHTGQFAWKFTKAGEFYYGCLQPGHFEAGMVGKVTVLP